MLLHRGDPVFQPFLPALLCQPAVSPTDTCGSRQHPRPVRPRDSQTLPSAQLGFPGHPYLLHLQSTSRCIHLSAGVESHVGIWPWCNDRCQIKLAEVNSFTRSLVSWAELR